MPYTYKIHSQHIREGRYEIFFGVWDESGRVVVDNQTRPIGKVKLNKTQLDSLFAEKIFPEIEVSLIIEEPQQTYQKEEVEDLLKTKGYLEINQKLEDLPDRADLLATVR